MGFVAVLGDVHGNKEAWDAVFRSISRKKDAGIDITHYICTGDIVGYGPDPRKSVQDIYLAQKAGNWVVVKGNHDNATAIKLDQPAAIIGASIGIKGLGGYEGIQWAVRQLCGDSTPIPLDSKPQKPAQPDDDAEKRYNTDVKDWRTNQIEPRTTEAVKKAYDNVRSNLNTLVNTMSGSGNGLPLHERFVSSKNLRRFCLEKALSSMDVEKLTAAQYHLEQYIVGMENEALRNYLSNLPASVKTVLDTGNAQVPILLVHDNPFEPGDSRYVVAKKPQEGSSKYSVDDILSAWDSRWPDTKVIFFGHSHIPGVYAGDNGRLIVNPGSVGIPRSDKLEATYALWNPEVEGRSSVEIVRLERAGWRMTQKKMKECGLPDKFEHVHAEVS
jgi:predicted phosphodiesterase